MTDDHDDTTPLPKHDTAFYRQSHASSYVIERGKEGAWPVARAPRLLVTTSFKRNNYSWPSGLTSCLRAVEGAERFCFSDAAHVHAVCSGRSDPSCRSLRHVTDSGGCSDAKEQRRWSARKGSTCKRRYAALPWFPGVPPRRRWRSCADRSSPSG